MIAKIGRATGARLIKSLPTMANALGTIVASVTPLRYSVRLDDGSNIEAILAKSALRKFGSLLGPLKDGVVVTVSLHDPPKQHRIIDVRMVTTGDILDVQVHAVTHYGLFCRSGEQQVLVLIPETSWIASYNSCEQFAAPGDRFRAKALHADSATG